ncbi:hypothetical protein BC937DRAFT_91460 [Endogone sp. FLAS-F59071]|nr:hypothetical protein BC937DRAFT_91460 [Endogone sp. FLAS-F59071]|eukprot:RUS21786.1 hypothetical protein BC937DRAFT_91460 [Endogone sp. FLAS-F59071]
MTNKIARSSPRATRSTSASPPEELMNPRAPQPSAPSKKRKSLSVPVVNQPTLETYNIQAASSSSGTASDFRKFQPGLEFFTTKKRLRVITTDNADDNAAYDAPELLLNQQHQIEETMFNFPSSTPITAQAAATTLSGSIMNNGNGNTMASSVTGISSNGAVRRPSAAQPSGVAKQPPKKLVIKNFKVKPRLPENYETEAWTKLQTAVHAIHQSQPVSDSLEALYKACENLCHHKLADSLYDRLQTECELYIKAQLEVLRSKNLAKEIYLEAINNCWLSHCRQMIMIRSIFLYLDRTYVLQTSGVSSLWDMGLDLFRKHIMGAEDVRKKTLEGCLLMIERERNGETIDRQLLKSLLRMYLDLAIYSSAFEGQFLESTRLYYHAEGERRINSLEVPKYLQNVEIRLKEEGTDRMLHYLDKSTKGPLVAVVEGELFERHVGTILEKGFDEMMNGNRKEDLSVLYTLLSRVNALEHLRSFFGIYVKKAGGTIVQDVGRDPTMVQDLLEFKAKMDEILANSFRRNEQFTNTLKESFESFVNSRQNKPAELIAKYLDSKLRSGNKTATDEELETILDKVLILFRYIQGKDVFEAFYKRDLAKRLLLGKSASFDAEKSMLLKLKTECGPGFTSKLEGMFKDIDLSRDIMTSFRNSKAHDQLHDIELYVNVLTQGYWPTYTPVEVVLPTQMAQYQEIFKNFYLSKHSGRRLMWQNSLGTCVLKASFPNGVKELSVSLFQAVVLLLFNDTSKHKLGYKEIRTLTNIDNKELLRTLQSLACGKVRVLQKHPKGRDVEESDDFSFYEEFSAPLYRIKINSIQLKETVEENTSTHERVFQDRQYQVDAAIVRIMKTRKTLSHNMLLTELFEQLRFPVKASDLKKRIESLMDREYLERDAEEASTYHYLA